MQSVCDSGRSLTAPSPLPVEFPILAYFGVTGISRMENQLLPRRKTQRNDVIISKRSKDFQSSTLLAEEPAFFKVLVKERFRRLKLS
jgi:hypothetical protein